MTIRVSLQKFKFRHRTINQSNMKTKKLWGILMLFLCTLNLTGCNNEDEEGRQITDYKEYLLTVASQQIPGVGWSDGFNYLTDLFPNLTNFCRYLAREAYQDIWNGRSWMNREMKHPILHSTSFSSEEHRQNPKTQRLSLRICISTLRNIIKNNTHRLV